MPDKLSRSGRQGVEAERLYSRRNAGGIESVLPGAMIQRKMSARNTGTSGSLPRILTGAVLLLLCVFLQGHALAHNLQDVLSCRPGVSDQNSDAARVQENPVICGCAPQLTPSVTPLLATRFGASLFAAHSTSLGDRDSVSHGGLRAETGVGWLVLISTFLL